MWERDGEGAGREDGTWGAPAPSALARPWAGGPGILGPRLPPGDTWETFSKSILCKTCV